MYLQTYLKQFKNIVWYPSAGKDSLAMACLSFAGLKECGISKEEVPDCFIYTDYATYARFADDGRFFLDLDEWRNKTSFCYDASLHEATAFNVRELERIRLGFDQKLVCFERDDYYGRVFIADVHIKHPVLGESVAKLVYVVAENTAFAFDFLLKKGIRTKYVIHSRYGFGFGGGQSHGAFLCHVLKELGTQYFASDMGDGGGYERRDPADEYLTIAQLNTVPVLRAMRNFGKAYSWVGIEDTVLYKVTDHLCAEYNSDNLKRLIIE